MLQKWIVGVALLVGLVSAAPVRADEHAERAAVMKKVGALMDARDFKALEQLAEQYRGTEARTSSGVWMLTQYYDGVSTYFNTRDKDPAVWNERAALATAWWNAYPDSPTPRLITAQLLVNTAWSYRGGGYARTVPRERWAAFRKQNAEAAEFIRKQKSVAVRDPYWYELTLLVGQRDGMEDAAYMAVFDEAAARYPRFYPLYFNAVSNFSPKWGGSGEAIEGFARHALKKVPRKDRAALYTRIYWVASQNQYGGDLFTDTNVNWRLMREGIDDVLAQYPTDWNLQNFAFFACRALDKPKTRQLMGRISAPPDREAWESFMAYDKCREWAMAGEVAPTKTGAALQSPFPPRVASAMQAVQARQSPAKDQQ